jgi:hypothetical protein
MYIVKNVPGYVADICAEWLVVTQVDNDLWFWGAWNDQTAAIDAAIEIDRENDTLNHWVLPIEDCVCEWRG